MSAFTDRLKTSDSTLYREYTDDLFAKYRSELRAVSACSDSVSLHAAQARMNLLVEQLRSCLRSDDTRLDYIP